MNEEQSKTEHCFEKLFVIWFFDDDEGYGIEVMGLTQKKSFLVVTTWTFGHGTEARDFRKAWGEYISALAFQQKSKLEPEILNLSLRYDFLSKQIKGDLSQAKKLLEKGGLNNE